MFKPIKPSAIAKEFKNEGSCNSDLSLKKTILKSSFSFNRAGFSMRWATIIVFLEIVSPP